ncbi:hypothetical protein BCR37DRAFT_18266 [Protomyces lactucae-debilis]|uniref:Uncharacterized protein n=1 Tax=Protomyces lactucae-debilis TaxID=2754530 RepID=A0A1Y2FXT6_PROLT|nr:uncharacterized protein BCR37DRAFT_18266 [Protomyces lactucae-debilis]ORY87976.1 hypothetical protein BCR37DRAFT_18266 [Protomyces lactucae-debilis]
MGDEWVSTAFNAGRQRQRQLALAACFVLRAGLANALGFVLSSSYNVYNRNAVLSRTSRKVEYLRRCSALFTHA